MRFNLIHKRLVLGLLAMTTVSPAELPEGEGKTLVEGYCTSCHAVNRITGSLGYDAGDWLALTASMIDLSAVPDQRQQLVDYLAEHFPPNDRRKPVLVDGQQKISFTEWVVPTPGQRSRDPVEAPDGKIWWVGQWGDIIGWINPETGEMREYPLPAGAKPHSVTIGADGSVWYTGNKNATLGLLNPETGAIKQYPMPDPSARDPHTAVFDQQGLLWFTLQQSNQVGRLNRDTGVIDLVTMPTERSRPYGIKVAANGDIYVACNGSNCLAQLDPKTMAIMEIKLPHEDSHVRRLDIDSQGNIWYVNSGRGRLGMYNPGDGSIKEWPSPSGPKSHPYALAVIDDIIWYNESAMRPDPLVRFDPKTQTFQSWPIPSGPFYGGIARHIRPTQAGDLLIHQSGTNRIIRVEIGE
jgi:virginiamycin B lyase